MLEAHVADDPGIPTGGLQVPGTQGILMPGSRIAGYVIEEQVGAGGMAIVYRARDEVLGRQVAVKVLSPALASDQEFRTRFLRESRAVAAVDEPHIVPVYGAGDADGVLYIASRFVAGGDLSRLQRAAAGPLPPAQVADLIAQVASALDAAHAIGLVHRDVKPGNILIERIPGRPEHAYLSDFGLSKSTTPDATGLTAVGRFMGTPDYCAPEQITGAEVDGRTDQYSLACVAFSLLAGVVPYGRGDSMARLFAHVNSPVPVLTSIRPELPPPADWALAKGMAKNPAERYESCAAFASALRGALGVGTGTFQGAALPTQPQDPGAAGTFGYQPTVTAGTSRHPSFPPGSGGWQPQGPGGGQRPPRKRTGLIIGVSATAVAVVAAVTVGAILGSQSSNRGGTPDLTRSSGATTPAAGRTSPGSSSHPASSPPAGHTGTATLVGSLSAPGGAQMKNAFFSPDGVYIAAVGTKSDVYIFSTETLKFVKTLSVGAGETAYPVSFSADDKTLYSIGWTTSKSEMYDLNVASGKATVYPLPSPVAETWNNLSGRMIAYYATTGGPITEYNADTGKVHAQVTNPGKAAVANAGPDADGNYMLISDTDGTAYLVDVQSKQVIGTFHYPYKGTSTIYPQLTPDGNTVYVPGGSTGPARLWDRTTKAYSTPTGSRWPNPDNGVLISTDSKFALSSPTAISDTVDIWDMATRAHVITLTVPGGQNEADLSFGPGGSELLSTEALDTAKGTFAKVKVWIIPG
jgi:serine/threonine-protein kinase